MKYVETIESPQTLDEWNAIVTNSKKIFFAKHDDYGSAWLILRPKSLTDQIFIKVRRIITLQDNEVQKVTGRLDDIPSEFAAIINYCVMGLIKIKLRANNDQRMEISTKELTVLFDESIKETQGKMLAKVIEYGETWRTLRISSLTDLICMNVIQLKIAENKNTTKILEGGPEAKYHDCINYAIFALILLKEKVSSPV